MAAKAKKPARGKPVTTPAPAARGSSLTVPDSVKAPVVPQRVSLLVTTLAKKIMKVEDELAVLAAQVDAKMKELFNLKTQSLPTAMQEGGVKTLGLVSGETVEVKDYVTGNIKEENKNKAHTWMRANGFGAYIKTTVK